MKAFIAIFVICSVQAVLAQRTFPGQCPQFTPLSNFNLDAFMKTWWGIEKYTFPQQTRCTRGVYENLGNNIISYTNVGISIATGEPVSFGFPARYFSNGQFLIEYNDQQPTDSPNFAVVGTNEETWAAVTWCKNISADQHEKIAFILASTSNPAPADITAAKNALEAASVDTSLLEKYDLTNCA